jgi:DNA polymerase-3 subunit epsilon
MAGLDQTVFVCLDCETTGLDPLADHIIEIAAVKFKFTETLESFESLIDPGCPINESSIEIHHITNQMVQGQPKVEEVLPKLLSLIGDHIIVGHGIGLDIAFICEAAKKHRIPCSLHKNRTLDTLRMARLYGESPTNSLEKLRQHFNIAAEGAHRAMNDVVVNIEVFKFLCSSYKTTEQLFERLKKPIALKAMPLGKHKGRPFAEIPIEYLQWAANKDFDQDLLFSIRSELNKRKKGTQFSQAANPFSKL